MIRYFKQPCECGNNDLARVSTVQIGNEPKIYRCVECHREINNPETIEMYEQRYKEYGVWFKNRKKRAEKRRKEHLQSLSFRDKQFKEKNGN